jgi:hypothetical protein
MAKTNAERQAAYRNRQPGAGENGYRQLNTWLSTKAALALRRLASHHGVTKQEMLERLITAEDDRMLATLPLDSPEYAAYRDRGTLLNTTQQ